MFVYLIAAAVGCLLLVGVLRAGSTDPFKAPYPNGLVEITLSAYIPNGVNAAILDTYTAKFDFIVRMAYESAKNGTANLDNVTVRTVDASKKILDDHVPADGATRMTLHSDCVNYQVVAGDKITLKATSTTSNASGWVTVRLLVEPYYQRVGQTG